MCVGCLFTLTGNGHGLLLWRHPLNVKPRTAARLCFSVEDKNYSRTMFVTPELLPMPAHSRSFGCRPAIAANQCCLPL